MAKDIANAYKYCHEYDIHIINKISFYFIYYDVSEKKNWYFFLKILFREKSENFVSNY